MKKEALLLTKKHVLICAYQDKRYNDLEYIKENFCGVVFENTKDFNNCGVSQGGIVYLCGNIEQIYCEIRENIMKCPVFAVTDFSNNYDDFSIMYKLIDAGQVPINIRNTGVYFRKFFNQEKDYFDIISKSHQFQSLTESNKQSNAFRKGIYLTKVEDFGEEIKFKLLRCSSNLNGPSDNFRDIDKQIIDKVNAYTKYFFDDSAELDHVLAQIYENKLVNINDKYVERKAKIKDHSDKTKDMPRNGLIAFTTFYDSFLGIKNSDKNPYDYCYKETSVLTKLRFRLKKPEKNPTFTKQFDVVLYPNSMFVISLFINRIYTHEIVPSGLPIDKIPTRMGYVIRCSKTNAIYKNNKTYIYEKGEYFLLEEPLEEDVKKLKDLYFKENATDEIINYDKFYFSLNKGDYEKPAK